MNYQLAKREFEKDFLAEVERVQGIEDLVGYWIAASVLHAKILRMANLEINYSALNEAVDRKWTDGSAILKSLANPKIKAYLICEPESDVEVNLRVDLS